MQQTVSLLQCTSCATWAWERPVTTHSCWSELWAVAGCSLGTYILNKHSRPSAFSNLQKGIFAGQAKWAAGRPAPLASSLRTGMEKRSTQVLSRRSLLRSSAAARRAAMDLHLLRASFLALQRPPIIKLYAHRSNDDTASQFAREEKNYFFDTFNALIKNWSSWACIDCCCQRYVVLNFCHDYNFNAQLNELLDDEEQ